VTKLSELLNRIDLRFDFVTAKLGQHTITPGGCWEYTGHCSKLGYGEFHVYAAQFDPPKRKYRAHRVAYAYHFGVDPGEMMVCHKCDNPACINPDHLFLGTAKDNSLDMVAKGRASVNDGERNPGAVVTESTVIEIVSAIKEGKSNKQIAERLPVSHGAVSRIRLGKSWRKVTQAIGYNPDEYRLFERKRAKAG
jgi:hypothetical protein